MDHYSSTSRHLQQNFKKFIVNHISCFNPAIFLITSSCLALINNFLSYSNPKPFFHSAMFSPFTNAIQFFNRGTRKNAVLPFSTLRSVYLTDYLAPLFRLAQILHGFRYLLQRLISCWFKGCF